MKVIDFHIHTISTMHDPSFEFDMDTLKEYVAELKIDAIAITNHNCFDLKQYERIREELQIDVFPGIEVDLENGHILVIASPDKSTEFSVQCDKMEIEENGQFISFETFKGIFYNYSDYLLVPHIGKKPVLKEETVLKFEGLITCGEVGNAKKFVLSKEIGDSMVPVLFSDFRPQKVKENEVEDQDSDYKTKFPVRITYLDINEISLNSIKLAFADKSKVFITPDKTAREFQILSNGTIASTKLNLIVGSRSSGKTHTLKSIKDTFGDNENVKYIKQFDIVKNCDDKSFNRMIELECENIVEKYQTSLKKLIEEIIIIDKSKIEYDVDMYISTLREFAMHQATSDVYSQTKVFNEEEYSINEPDEIIKVLESLIRIYTNKAYKETMKKYIDFDNLEKLIKEMILIRNKEYRTVCLKKETNLIIEELQKILSSKSSKTSPTQCDFNKLWLDKSKIARFDSLLEQYKTKQVIHRKKLPRFNLTISKHKFENVSSLKKANKLSMSLIEEFKYYDQTYDYLMKLKDAGVPQADLYKCLVGFKHSITNGAGVEISGGERAEYKLEKEIKDAIRYDVLLIDELESSFDNIFIRNYIIKMIKEISKKTTVFLVTHNNTLGPLLYPNWVIYNECKDGEFKIFYGSFEAKKLKTFDGEEIPNIDVLLNTMEAGELAYNERKNIYENIKN